MPTALAAIRDSRMQMDDEIAGFDDIFAEYKRKLEATSKQSGVDLNTIDENLTNRKSESAESWKGHAKWRLQSCPKPDVQLLDMIDKTL